MSTPNAELVSYAQTPAHAAPAGELVLDRYRLVRRIGAGGMGVVFLALDEHLQREVAVKRIAIELDPDGRGEREARAAARLSHAAIVSLYESGRDDDAVYLVSELVRGRTLAELIRAGELSDRDVVRIGMTLCDALEHAHQRGVIHRDVKPSNILCPQPADESAVVAKLTDFGIAMMADGDVLTRTGDIMGTLAYMAPEQARGTGVTGATDVYALGVVLYEGLAGVNPVRAGNPAATVRRVGMRLPPLHRVRRDLPAGLCRAIDAAVVPEPQQRAGLGLLRLGLTHAVDRVAEAVGPIASDAPTERSPSRTGEATQPAGRPPARADRPRRPAPPLVVPQAAPIPRPRSQTPAPRGEYEDDQPAPVAGPRARRPGQRAAAAGAAGALAGTALAFLGPPPPVDPALAALTASLAVLILPRIGWLATAFALLVWLAAAAPGLGVIVALGAAAVPLLLARRRLAWSLPAGAPLLGLLGVAGAWPAVAGQARSWSTRAALGALGGLWLVLAEALSDGRLLTGQPRDVLAPGAWQDSVLDGVRDGAAPLLAGGTLAFAALWAVAAVLLPLLVRGRSAAMDLVAATGWAAALAASTQAISRALVLDAPRGLAAGAVLAVAVAVGSRAARARG